MIIHTENGSYVVKATGKGFEGQKIEAYKVSNWYAVGEVFKFNRLEAQVGEPALFGFQEDKTTGKPFSVRTGKVTSIMRDDPEEGPTQGKPLHNWGY